MGADMISVTAMLLVWWF